ncbi:MerR family transcriptional regulator [Microbispora sp. NPDC049633]|uniref:MerR family transcriptional regulator n=1 Tax=Microbispora sp. NPDC049633 TaxID=3154355 RepID=UPI003440859B
MSRPRGSTIEGGTAEAAARLGLTWRQLDHWTRKGYLHPEGGGQTGVARIWPETELRIAALIARFSAAGLVMESAASVARSIVAFGLVEVELGEGITLKIQD